jgi:hypothetical protein
MYKTLYQIFKNLQVKFFPQTFLCHPERSEGSHFLMFFVNMRFFASLRMTSLRSELFAGCRKDYVDFTNILSILS